MSDNINETENSLKAEGVESTFSPTNPLTQNAKPLGRECELPHVGLPRSAFHGSEGELKNLQLAQHRVETSRLLSGM